MWEFLFFVATNALTIYMFSQKLGYVRAFLFMLFSRLVFIKATISFFEVGFRRLNGEYVSKIEEVIIALICLISILIIIRYLESRKDIQDLHIFLFIIYQLSVACIDYYYFNVKSIPFVPSFDLNRG